MGANGRVFLPPLVRVSYARLNPAGAYLLENGQKLFLWLGREIPSQFLQDVFGVQTIESVDSSMVSEKWCLATRMNVTLPLFFPLETSDKE